MNDWFECLFTQWTLWFHLFPIENSKFKLIYSFSSDSSLKCGCVSNHKFINPSSIQTLLHSSKQLKQNWCIHESVKHLLFTRPKQIEQFGGGEWLASWRCWSSLLFPDSPADPFDDLYSWCFFKNSRIRKLVGGSVRADVLFDEKSICPSGVGHSITNSAISFICCCMSCFFLRFVYLKFWFDYFYCISRTWRYIKKCHLKIRRDHQFYFNEAHFSNLCCAYAISNVYNLQSQFYFSEMLHIQMIPFREFALGQIVIINTQAFIYM